MQSIVSFARRLPKTSLRSSSQFTTTSPSRSSNPSARIRFETRDIALCCIVALLFGCGGAAPSSSRIGQPDRDLRNGRAGEAPADHDHRLRGEASYYARKFHGRVTASGEAFDMYGFTAAHKTLPFHTIVRVTHPKTQKSVVVRINDRGPYIDGRIIDLSWAAAADLGLLERGVIEVRLKVLSWGDGSRVSR